MITRKDKPTGDPIDPNVVLKNATPYLRSICAFLLYLRFSGSSGSPRMSPDQAYGMADTFIGTLKADVEASE